MPVHGDPRVLLPAKKEWDSAKYTVPGPGLVHDMAPIFEAQRSEMHTTTNKQGWSKVSTTDTPSLEDRFQKPDDYDGATVFAMQELIANTLDVNIQAGMLEGENITFVVNETNQAVSR